MKRISQIISLAFIIGLIPFSIVTGQEKKSEQKVKIIVSDDSGTKVVLDTLFSDDLMRDSIMLKNGKIIFIDESGANTRLVSKDGTDHYFVTVTADGKNTKRESKEITIVSSDPVNWVSAKADGKSYAYSIKSEKAENRGSDYERTKYVITKDGMVITIEGEDYVKVKKLADEIGGKIDAEKDVETKANAKKK